MFRKVLRLSNMEGIGLNTTVKFIINLEWFQCNIYGDTKQNYSQTTVINWFEVSVNLQVTHLMA